MSRELGQHYVLTHVIGRGAMGEVWQGHHRASPGTPLAFKLLHDTLARDPQIVSRFVQERTILTGIEHRNLVRVLDLVVEGDTLAIVMEFVAGGDLAAFLKQYGALPPAVVCSIGADIASGLGVVHAGGTVHRDVKPENVLLDSSTRPPTPKVTDFGIAKATAGSSFAESTLLAGTPHYIAPELYDGQPPTPASDLYALGILLYALSCGVPPFSGNSRLSLMKAHAEKAPGRPPGVPDELWEVIAALLAKNPAQRPRSAEQVASMLRVLSFDLGGLPAAPTLTAPPQPQPTVPPPAPNPPPGPGPLPSTVVNQQAPHHVPAQHYTPTPAKRGRKGLVVAALAVAALLVVGAIALSGPLRGTGGEGVDIAGGGGPVATNAATSTTTTQTTTSAPPTTTVAPGTMPNLVGMSATTATNRLPRDTEVTVEYAAAAPGQPDGVVVAQEPASGQRLDGAVTLTVSASEVTVDLIDLKPLSKSFEWNTGAVDISGESFVRSAWFRVTRNTRSSWVEFNLGRNFTTLTTTLGITDTSTYGDARVKLEFFGDNNQKLREDTVTLGSAVEVELPVSNVLRLRIVATLLNPPSRYDDAYAALGSPQLTAAPGYVPEPTR